MVILVQMVFYEYISSRRSTNWIVKFCNSYWIIFGRFSKPTAYIKFSHNALLSPYKDGIALMMRLVPYKNTNLYDAEVKVTLAMNIEENGKELINSII